MNEQEGRVRVLLRVVADYCQRKGLSANVVATLTKISQPTVSRALAGRGKCYCDTLDQLILRVPVDEVVLLKLVLIRVRAVRQVKW